MIEPLDCSECKMEDRCKRTREDCRYPEGRKYGVVHQGLSILDQLEKAIETLRFYANRDNWEEIQDCDGLGYETHGRLYIEGPEVAIKCLKDLGEE